MEFILPTLKLFTYLGIGMIVLGVLVFIGIFKGSRSPLNYIIGGIICIAIGIVFLSIKTAGSITVAENQMTLKAALTKTQVIQVDKIKKAWVEELENSEWGPVKKKSGSAIGKIRTGWFTLKNGRTAYLVLQGNRALCIEADQEHMFLVGIEEFDLFLSQLKSEMPKLAQLLE
ncbi:MAG: PH domain-containing protein [Candidatus Aminicenantes bacterium]|nr:PH domain-containing protein [Candidatus Aminicenantes bacterium]